MLSTQPAARRSGASRDRPRRWPKPRAGRTVSIGGGIGSTLIDNTQDALNPDLKTGLGVNVETTVEDVELYAGMGGAACPP